MSFWNEKFVSKIKGNDKIRFLFSGGLNTALTYFEVLILDIFFVYPLAYTLSVIIGVIQGFFLHKFVSFQSKGKVKNEIWKFIIVATIAYVLGLLVLYLLITIINLPAYIGFFINSCFCAVTSYFGHKFISFKKKD